MFVNLYNDKVLEVAGGKDSEGTRIQVGSANSRKHQKWYILYVADKKKDTTTHNFGFRVNTPFYI
jgi:hypothetical protein